jgi:hypothetical protein
VVRNMRPNASRRAPDLGSCATAAFDVLTLSSYDHDPRIHPPPRE